MHTFCSNFFRLELIGLPWISDSFNRFLFFNLKNYQPLWLKASPLSPVRPQLSLELRLQDGQAILLWVQAFGLSLRRPVSILLEALSSNLSSHIPVMKSSAFPMSSNQVLNLPAELIIRVGNCVSTGSGCVCLVGKLLPCCLRLWPPSPSGNRVRLGRLCRSVLISWQSSFCRLALASSRFLVRVLASVAGNSALFLKLSWESPLSWGVGSSFRGAWADSFRVYGEKHPPRTPLH